MAFHVEWILIHVCLLQIESVTKQLLEGDEEIGDVASLLTRISSLRRDISVISDMTVAALSPSPCTRHTRITSPPPVKLCLPLHLEAHLIPVLALP
jgi:hypothetical protein